MDQDLRVRISGWRFESARSHETYRLRSGIGLVSKSDQRGSTPRRPASAASSSPGGEIGFIRRTCRVRSPGLLRRSERRLIRRVCRSSDRYLASRSPGGDRSPTNCMRRVRFPGSLPVFSFSWCAQCDGRTRVCESRSEGSIPSAHPAPGRVRGAPIWSRNPLVRMRGCLPR